VRAGKPFTLTCPARTARALSFRDATPHSESNLSNRMLASLFSGTFADPLLQNRHLDYYTTFLKICQVISWFPIKKGLIHLAQNKNTQAK
jgi:hypothetical protein